jgi:hypothetical protein
MPQGHSDMEHVSLYTCVCRMLFSTDAVPTDHMNHAFPQLKWDPVTKLTRILTRDIVAKQYVFPDFQTNFDPSDSPHETERFNLVPTYFLCRDRNFISLPSNCIAGSYCSAPVSLLVTGQTDRNLF